VAFADHIQSTKKDAGSVSSSTTLAYTSNVTVGNSLLVVLRKGGTTGTITLSDNLNGTWGAADDTLQVTNTGQMTLWRFSNTAAGACTITVSISGATQTLRFIIAEYEGNFGLDTVGHNQGSSTSLTSNAQSTGQTDCVIGFGVAGGNVGSNETFTQTGSFTNRQILTALIGGNNKDVVYLGDMNGAQAAGSFTFTGTLSGTDNFGAGVAGYYNAAAGAPTNREFIRRSKGLWVPTGRRAS